LSSTALSTTTSLPTATAARRVVIPQLGLGRIAATWAAAAVPMGLLSWVVAEAITRLSEEHRAVLLECYYRGRPVAEAARLLGVPAGTVKSRTHYALRALRLALEEMGVTA